MAAWKSSSTTMKTEPLPAPCPFCGSREAALRARVTEVEVQAERYRLATLRQDADLARVTAERDQLQSIAEKRYEEFRREANAHFVAAGEIEKLETRCGELVAALRDAVGMLEELDGLDWGEEGMPFDVDFNHFAKVLSPVPFGGAVGRDPAAEELAEADEVDHARVASTGAMPSASSGS